MSSEDFPSFGNQPLASLQMFQQHTVAVAFGACYVTMLHFWSDSRNPPCSSSSHLGLLWKVILFAPLLLQLVHAQDEVHHHMKSIICRKLFCSKIFLLGHPKMPGKILNCANFSTRLLFNKQVGEMDNTDVPSDYTSNCLPPNCLPR